MTRAASFLAGLAGVSAITMLAIADTRDGSVVMSGLTTFLVLQLMLVGGASVMAAQLWRIADALERRNELLEEETEDEP